MLATGRRSVHVTRGQPMAVAEVIRAHRTREAARTAGDMVCRTHDQLPWRAGTRRTGHRPRAAAAQRPMPNETAGPPLRRLEGPLRALYQELSLHDLQRMHDGTHMMPPPLLGGTSLVLGRKRLTLRSLERAVTQERAIVTVDSRKLGGERMLSVRFEASDLIRELPLKVSEHELHELAHRLGGGNERVTGCSDRSG